MNELDVSADQAAELARPVFATLRRADQRRWAEVFIRGLVSVPGRKTIRKISDQVAGGGVEQCLQQFVGQSTWQWDTVRADLAMELYESLAPRAWVIKDAVFPKNGSKSVGVARQFASSAGRVLNCQMALAVFLAADDWSCPVNWRLSLPPSWDDDKERRGESHIPHAERSVPRWHQMLEAIDEMTVDWGLRPLPLVADMSQCAELDPLLAGLEERHIRYLIRVGPNQSAVTARPAQGPPRTLSWAQFISAALAQRTATLIMWGKAPGRPGMVQLIAVRLPADARSTVLRVPPRGPRYVVAEWSPVRKSAQSVWVTSAEPRHIPGILEDAALDQRADADLTELCERLGLLQFEGRSFAGWHHYVTLVSIAHACRHLWRARRSASMVMSSDCSAVPTYRVTASSTASSSA